MFQLIFFSGIQTFCFSLLFFAGHQALFLTTMHREILLVLIRVAGFDLALPYLYLVPAVLHQLQNLKIWIIVTSFVTTIVFLYQEWNISSRGYNQD